MTSLRDKVRKNIETASALKETAGLSIKKDANKVKNYSDSYRILGIKGDAQADAIADFIGKELEGYDMDASNSAPNDFQVVVNVKPGMDKVKTNRDVYAAVKAAVAKFNKEKASTKEIAAKKHKSTAKMVSKISAIIQAMGMDEGQWDAVSKQVFKKAFGGKKEKAGTETASPEKSKEQFMSQLAYNLKNLTSAHNFLVKAPKLSNLEAVRWQLDATSEYVTENKVLFK